jgi:hypothetical protein
MVSNPPPLDKEHLTVDHLRIALCCALLAGCSGGTAATAAPPLPAGPDVRAAFKIRPDAATFKKLAVSNYGDYGSANVQVFNKAYKPTQTITSGLAENDGIWIDANDNLYAANLGGTVTEYALGSAKGRSHPFTYSTGMTAPISVTTDGSGNVFIGEGDTYPGHVDEFPQGSNAPIARCATPDGGLVTGVTVDKNGNVFIGSVQSSGASHLVEFAGGLGGCNSTELPAPVYYVGGVELDKSGNLVVEEQTLGDILIIPPPYSNVQTTLTGFSGDPYQLALNADDTLLFVDEGNNDAIVVAQYPSGTIETTLTTDLTSAYGVAVYPPPSPAQ